MKFALCAKLGSGKNASFDILKSHIPTLVEVKMASTMYEIHDTIQENTLFLRTTTTGSNEHIISLIDKLVEYKLQHGWSFLNPKAKEFIKLTQLLVKDTLFLQTKHKNANYLQHLGTAIGREINSNLWVDQFLKKIDSLEDICCTDVRFENELIACKEKGFIMIRLVRDFDARKDYIAGRDPQHASEIGLDHIPDTEFDYVIHNNGTLEDLTEKLYNIIQENI